MVHCTKQKKVKGDTTFKVKKQKVGRKKLAPATATRAEVHARTLRIVAPSSFQKEIKDDGERAQPNRRTLQENLVATTHYKDTVRKSALAALCLTVSKQVEVVTPLTKLSLMRAALNSLTDTSPEVRKSSLSLLSLVLPRTQTALDGSTSPHARLMFDYVRIALTHAQLGVRKSGMSLLAIVLHTWPGTIRSLPRFEAERVLRWAATMALNHKQIDVLAILLRDALPLHQVAATESTGPGLEGVISFWNDHRERFSVAWKEHMELGVALFRDEGTLAVASSIASCVASVTIFLRRHSALSAEQCRWLRDMFVTQVPLTMKQLCTTCSRFASSFASVLALTLIPIATGASEPLKLLLVFVSHRWNYVGVASSVLRLLLDLFPEHIACASKRMPSLLEQAASELCNHLPQRSLTEQGVRDLLALADMICDMQPQQCGEGVTRCLHSVLEVVPKFLFMLRCWPENLVADEAVVAVRFVDEVCHCVLSFVWRLVSAAHPAATVMDMKNWGSQLQSLWGIGSADGHSVPGVLAQCCARTQRLAAHVFFYLGILPATPLASLVLRDAHECPNW